MLEAKNVPLGRLANGWRVTVDVRYGPDEMGNAEKRPVCESVTHEQVPYPNVLSIQGVLRNAIRRGDDGIESIGQIVGDVRYITEPAGRLTTNTLSRFADLWDRWHLNDFRAACAHMTEEMMTPPAGWTKVQGWRLDNVVCPVTGYRYGHAWLVEEVPAEVVDEIEKIVQEARRRG